MRERLWRSAQKSCVRPLPERLGVQPRGRSRRLERVLTDFGSEPAFARAAASVQEHYGVEIGASAVRGCTLKHAQRARQSLEAGYEQSYRVLPAVAAEHVIAEADGTMICTVQSGQRKGKRPQEGKEMRLTAAQAKGSATTVSAATFGSVEETGRRLGHCAKAAGRRLNSRIHAVGDGAKWIRMQTREVFGERGHFLREFFHPSEYLGAAAPKPAAPPTPRRGDGANRSGCDAVQ